MHVWKAKNNPHSSWFMIFGYRTVEHVLLPAIVYSTCTWFILEIKVVLIFTLMYLPSFLVYGHLVIHVRNCICTHIKICTLIFLCCRFSWLQPNCRPFRCNYKESRVISLSSSSPQNSQPYRAYRQSHRQTSHSLDRYRSIFKS